MKTRLIIIDGTNFFFKGSWGGVLTCDGHNVKNLYAFVGNICSMIREFEDSEHTVDVVVCWDGGYDERLRISEEAVQKGIIPKSYKQERREAKDSESAEDRDFVWQLKKAQEMLSYTRVHQCRMLGEEADDVAGSYCRRFLDRYDDIILVTTDRDYYQLLWKKVRIYNATKKEFYSLDDLGREFGLTRPEQWIDVGAIAGESGSSSDTIYGVPGIGYRGASEVIARHGSLEGVYQFAESHFASDIQSQGYEEFKRKVLNKEIKLQPKEKKEAMVLACRDVLDVAYRLKGMHTDLDVELCETCPSWEDLEEFFSSLRFKISINNFQTLLKKPSCTHVQFPLEAQE